MFENLTKFFKKKTKKQNNTSNSKDTAKERLHLVLMQDRANVSADFLDLMRREIIDVIKKYIEVDESAIDVRLTNKENEDGTNGAPALYANIPIINIKEETRKEEGKLAKEKQEAEAPKSDDNETGKEEKVENQPNSENIEDSKQQESDIKPQTQNEDSNKLQEENTENNTEEQKVENIEEKQGA